MISLIRPLFHVLTMDNTGQAGLTEGLGLIGQHLLKTISA